MTNSSLNSGSVSDKLKLAAVTPILKRPGPGLDPLDLDSTVAPSSIFPSCQTYLSVVKVHLIPNDLLEPFLSGSQPNDLQ